MADWAFVERAVKTVWTCSASAWVMERPAQYSRPAGGARLLGLPRDPELHHQPGTPCRLAGPDQAQLLETGVDSVPSGYVHHGADGRL